MLTSRYPARPDLPRPADRAARAGGLGTY